MLKGQHVSGGKSRGGLWAGGLLFERREAWMNVCVISVGLGWRFDVGGEGGDAMAVVDEGRRLVVGECCRQQ